MQILGTPYGVPFVIHAKLFTDSRIGISENMSTYHYGRCFSYAQKPSVAGGSR